MSWLWNGNWKLLTGVTIGVGLVAIILANKKVEVKRPAIAHKKGNTRRRRQRIKAEDCKFPISKLRVMDGTKIEALLNEAQQEKLDAGSALNVRFVVMERTLEHTLLGLRYGHFKEAEVKQRLELMRAGYVELAEVAALLHHELEINTYIALAKLPITPPTESAEYFRQAFSVMMESAVTAELLTQHTDVLKNSMILCVATNIPENEKKDVAESIRGTFEMIISKLRSYQLKSRVPAGMEPAPEKGEGNRHYDHIPELKDRPEDSDPLSYMHILLLNLAAELERNDMEKQTMDVVERENMTERSKLCSKHRAFYAFLCAMMQQPMMQFDKASENMILFIRFSMADMTGVIRTQLLHPQFKQFRGTPTHMIMTSRLFTDVDDYLKIHTDQCILSFICLYECEKDEEARKYMREFVTTLETVYELLDGVAPGKTAERTVISGLLDWLSKTEFDPEFASVLGSEVRQRLVQKGFAVDTSTLQLKEEPLD